MAPSTTAATPHSATSALPQGAGATPSLSTKGSGSTPAPPEEHAHVRAPSGRETPKEPRANGTTSTAAADKAERERAKRERKKERKQQDRVDREAASKDGAGGTSGAASPAPAEEKNGTEPGNFPPRSSDATADIVRPGSTVDTKSPEDGVISPATESTGARTPTSRRPSRHPWTIFMRLSVPANEQEVKDFFGDANEGVSDVIR